MDKQKAGEVFKILSKSNPEPETELEFKDPYTLLVAVILSAQATDVGVNKATPALFKAADTPEKMVALGVDKIRNYVKTIGLFNSKAKNVFAMSQMLLDEHDGKVPETREELQQLPGVGRKTANVVLNCAFKKPTMAVDTHVQRVSNRIGLARSKDVLKIELQLLKKIPEAYLLHAHHWLILHGRYVCKARKPECEKCSINSLCEYKAKTI